MAVLLLKAIFAVLTMLSNFISLVVFTITAHFLVQVIQLLKLPAEGSKWMLEQVRDVIKACLDYLLEIMIQAMGSFVSSLFDLMKDGVFSSSSGLVGAVMGLLEKSKTSLGQAAEDVPEALNAFADMVVKIMADFLNNCNDAITYVSENMLK